MNVVLKVAVLSLLFPAAAATVSAQQDYFSNWPAGRSPQEVGKALAEHFILTPHTPNHTITYSEVGTWYGALTFAELAHDTDLRDAPRLPSSPRATMSMTPSSASCLSRSPCKPKTKSI